MRNWDKAKDKMAKYRVILIGIGLALLFWVQETFIEVFVINEGTFTERLFMPDAHELWMRTLGIGIILVFSLYMQTVLNKRKSIEDELRALSDHLEVLVEERTAKLANANKSLEKDVIQRKKTVLAIKEAERQLRYSESQLRLLSRQIISAQENERIRIARELHDQLCQMIIAMRLEAQSLMKHAGGPQESSKITALVDSLDELLDSIRSIVTSLRPKILDDLGLMKAIECYAEDFERRTGISCPVNILDGNMETIAIQQDVAIIAYRITQEALINVLRHAKATSTKIEISADKSRLIVSVVDNGIGLKITELEQKSAMGILGMRERASLVNGTLKIRSSPGKGTRVIADLPLLSNQTAVELESVLKT